MTECLTIRRAKQEDFGAITDLVREATALTQAGGPAVGPEVIQDWLLGKGVWVALRGGTLLGVAGWQVENLVSVTDVLYIVPGPSWVEAGSRLLATIEAEATVLMCEISAVLLPNGTSSDVGELLRDLGYEDAELEELHRFWQEVLGDFMEAGPAIMVKHLRDRMVMVPR